MGFSVYDIWRSPIVIPCRRLRACRAKDEGVALCAGGSSLGAPEDTPADTCRQAPGQEVLRGVGSCPCQAARCCV